jgi:hypothetical protein
MSAISNLTGAVAAAAEFFAAASAGFVVEGADCPKTAPARFINSTAPAIIRILIGIPQSNLRIGFESESGCAHRAFPQLSTLAALKTRRKSRLLSLRMKTRRMFARWRVF